MDSRTARDTSTNPASKSRRLSLSKLLTASHLILVKMKVKRAIRVRAIASTKRITDIFWLVPKTIGIGPIIKTPPPSNLCSLLRRSDVAKSNRKPPTIKASPEKSKISGRFILNYPSIKSLENIKIFLATYLLAGSPLAL